DARNRQAHGDRASEVERAESAADAQARAMLQKAQSLLGDRKKLTGTAKLQKIIEAMAYLDEVRKQGGAWKDKADALAKAEITDEELVQIDEIKNPFPAWGEARELLRKSEFARAVPFLKEVLASDDPKATLHHREAEYYLGAGLFQTKDYHGALTQLTKFLSADGASGQFIADAVYLRFKSAEALY